MLVYRIVLKKYSTSLFAPGFAGRWNSTGRKVVYTAESIPLAFLENMVRRKGVGFNTDFATMIIEIPDKLTIEKVDPARLPPGWRDFHDYSKCQPFGDDWYDKGDAAVLKVPSAVLPEAHNFVLNTLHRDFKMIKIVKTTELIPDERIEDILKEYRK